MDDKSVRNDKSQCALQSWEGELEEASVKTDGDVTVM